ncbi:hypothetical protein BJY52DRAFT_305352 [Lactarius psammicola]|nr:hypothetical protein BJY52DRAFT_305352 [Lactarius psammicola]
MFSIPSSSDLRTRSFAISSRHLPANSRSLASTSISFPFHSAFNSHPQPFEISHSSVYRPSHAPPKMFYDDHDPRIGPEEMPSPHSEYAPYYSGCADTFEDFLDEFEGRAYDCELTDPQRVDAIIRYVDPSIQELCRTLSGFRPRDWSMFRQSLLDTFGRTTPRPQVMRQKLQSYVQDSSRTRMDSVDDVLQYYRDFLCLSAPIVHSGHLTEEDRDAAFWHGFHPEDRSKLWPRLIGKNPLQPHGIPFHFEDVLSCARGTFAYDGYFSSWTPEHRSKPSSVRREQPVAEHVSRDTCGPREVSRAVVSNAEKESTHSSSELLSPPTPDPQLPISSSLSTSELQHPHTRSATVDQPEDAPTFSIHSSTLFPLSSPSVSESRYTLAHSATVDHPEAASTLSIPSSTLLPSTSSVPTPSLPPSAADDDPEHAPTFSNSSSTFLPSTPSVRLTPSTADDDPEHAPTFSDSSFIPLPSTSPAPTRSLAHSVADDVSEIISTPSPMLSIPSDFESLSSEKEVQPESELVSMSSTTPTSLSLLSTPSLSSPSDTDVSELASAPSSSLSISPDPECLPSATEDQPETESASMSLIPSKFDMPTCALSPLPDHSSTSISSLSTSEVSPSLEVLIPNTFPVALLPDRSSFLSENLSPCEFESASTPSSTVDVVPPSSPESSPSSLSEVIPHTSDANSRTRAPILPFGATLFDSDSRAFEMTPARASSTVPSNAQPVDPSLENYPPFRSARLVPRMLDQVDSNSITLSPSTPVLPHSSSLQQSLGVTSDNTVSSPLEIAPISASATFTRVAQQVPTQWLLYLVPQLLKSQEPLLVPEVTSMRTPRLTHSLPPLRMSGFRSAHFDFALIIVTTAVLVFVFPNVLATFLSHARKFGNKNKDLSDRQNSNLKTGNTFAQRLRLQYTPHAARFVFDPGGPTSTHEDVRKRKSKSRGGFVTTHDATLPTLVLVGNRTVFIAETLKFFSRRSLTGDGQDLNPLGGVRPALGLGLKRASRCHIGVTPFPGMPCILPYLF